MLASASNNTPTRIVEAARFLLTVLTAFLRIRHYIWSATSGAVAAT